MTTSTRFRFWLWLIRLIGVIVPTRLRADWRQEWEAELQRREELLAEWDRLDWQGKLDLLWRSTSAFWDALWMQTYRWEDEIIQDLRYGARMLLKNPRFTLIAVVALSLGIGANTAIFSVVNAVLLKPLPYYDPQRLVLVTEVARDKEGGWIDEYAGAIDFILWQTETNAFEHLVAFNSGNMFLTGRGEPERLNAVWATADLLPALGVAPRLGRTFTPEEDRPEGAGVVILSHAFWQQRFGADPDIVGQSLTLDRKSCQVIGVMPPGFKFIQKADVLLPLAIDVQLELSRNVDGSSYRLGNIIGRLKPGASVAQARSELDSILQRGKQDNPKLSYGGKAIVTPLGARLVGQLQRGLLLLFGAVAFILLIACANVANLMLASARLRQKEMAIRAALGARPGRLVRQLLTESLLLSMCGGVAGLLSALLCVKALAPLTPDHLEHLKETGVDGVTLGFTSLVALLTGVIAGIIPALQNSRMGLNESLKEGARSALFKKRTSGRRISPALVIGEVALTLVLLAGAGLLIKSFVRVLAVEPGYNPENLLTMSIPLPRAGYPPRSAQRRVFYQELLTRINSTPGVKVGAVGPLPVWMDASSPPEVGTTGNVVSTDYFQAMGMELRAGRGFTEWDDQNAPPAVVINETLARRDFAGEDPIGKQVTYGFDGPRRIYGTVVGVVADVKRFGLEARVPAQEYHSVLQQVPFGDIDLVVRTYGDPLKLAPAVRQQVWTIDRNMPVVDVMSMEQRLDESVATRRFQMLLFGAFAAVALVLAAVGVYGVISYSVSRRSHEIAIRVALGAAPRNVRLLVVRQGMVSVLIGVGMGLAAALALTRLMERLLFNVTATDPATFAGISLLLTGAAFFAAYLPARRATRVDPAVALRHE